MIRHNIGVIVIIFDLKLIIKPPYT
jgi:hypothetical protein